MKNRLVLELALISRPMNKTVEVGVVFVAVGVVEVPMPFLVFHAVFQSTFFLYL